MKRLTDMSLGEKQRRFTLLTAKLIQWANDGGYELTYGEAWRTPEQAALNAMGPTGRGRLADFVSGAFPRLAALFRASAAIGADPSAHGQRLAVDLNLFRNGEWLKDTKDHEPLGLYWESLGGSWGGRHSKSDGNHYSLEHNGLK